jgi:hypothetical protein
MAEVRPATPQPRMTIAEPVRRDGLSAQEIAFALRVPLRTAQYRIAVWFARQDDGTLPRVRRVQTTAGKWAYRVDDASFEIYQLEHEDEVPPCASSSAVLLGCTCAIVELADGPGAMVAASCPVHGSIVRAG